MKLTSSAVAVVSCAGLAAAQWSATETQEVEPGVAPVGFDFGASIAISGDTALVGQPFESISTAAGTAHVFAIDPLTGLWTETATLQGGPFFAWGGVDLSGDTAVVGAPDLSPAPPQEGKLYVFERDAFGSWTGKAVLLSPQTVKGFAEQVAISGNTIVTGGVGSACVFERDLGGPGAWGLAAVLSDTDSDDSRFGYDVDVEGDQILAGAPMWELNGVGTGGAFVFQRSAAGAWNPMTVLSASDGAAGDAFGRAVALSGGTAIVGAPEDNSAGSAYVFEGAGSQWQELAKLVSPDPSTNDFFGTFLALDADTAVVAEEAFEEMSSAMVFKQNQGGPGAWQPAVELPTTPPFRGGMAVSGGVVAIDEAKDSNANNISGLAFDSVTDRLFGTGTYGPAAYLFVLDPVSGVATPVGPTGTDLLSGLAFDPSTATLYATEVDDDQLWRIDPATGAATLVGPLGFGFVLGLEFDPLSGTLYGTDTQTDQLIEIDAGTGAATAIGSIGFDVAGLALDPLTGALYGTGGQFTGQLLAIDAGTGQGTLIGTTGFFSLQGLALDPSSGTLYATSSPEMYSIDPATATTTALPNYFVPDSGDRVHVFELSHASETYCTTGTSASGCTALIASSGQPSASAPSGFKLSASGVEGGKDGLFFFGSHGRQANPWGNGTSYQCVVPPVKRTGLLAGVGTNGACDGSFARDLNAFWCPGCPAPLANPGAGAMVQAQLWYRDPASTSNQPTSLSDAVESYVTP
jgi:hypothetical protein